MTKEQMRSRKTYWVRKVAMQSMHATTIQRHQVAALEQGMRLISAAVPAVRKRQKV